MAPGHLQGSSNSYSSKVLSHWDQFLDLARPEAPVAVTDALSLSLAYVVAVAKNGAAVRLDDRVVERLDQTHKALQDSLADGEVIYGVNTGFGGSANTRTTKFTLLQRTLLREFNSGVLVSSESQRRHGSPSQFGGLSSQDLVSVNSMPVSWVRAALMVRINSLARGASGVRSRVVQQMVRLLENDIIPQVPMHGSISASGDLAPLSYLGSAIQGKANSVCTVGAVKGQPRVMSAREAMKAQNIRPEKIVAKEALAIMNGTAFSTGLGALVMHETHQVVVMSEVLTAMSVEALRGSDESFDPFFASVRPHPGQTDAARCIHALLKGSKLINTNSAEAGILKQDRYSIRTVSQWLSPVLEDLSLAHDQISIECNSVTDNPLVDLHPEAGVRYLHGGNFQARSVTSAMEKARQSLQSVGRMIFAQASEIINPVTNNGLSPNLVFDEPSESFLFKSIDIMVASLVSELGFLANNAGSHVQTAEMGNQGLNSLALISGRYTLSAVDLVAKLEAAHLLICCQAFDLRAMYEKFFAAVEPRIAQLASDWQLGLLSGSVAYDMEALKASTSTLATQLLVGVSKHFNTSPEMDSTERFKYISKALQPILLAQDPRTLPRRPQQEAPLYYSSGQHQKPPTPPSGGFPPADFQAAAAAASAEDDKHPQSPFYSSTFKNSHNTPFDTFHAINTWTSRIAETLKQTWDETRAAYVKSPDATPYLGVASAVMYRFVRKDLEVPLLHSALLAGDDDFEEDDELAAEAPYAPTVGLFMTRVYEAMRSGELSVPAMECLRAATATPEQVKSRDKASAAPVPTKGNFETLVPTANGAAREVPAQNAMVGIIDLAVKGEVRIDSATSSKRSSGGDWLQLSPANNSAENSATEAATKGAPIAPATNDTPIAPATGLQEPQQEQQQPEAQPDTADAAAAMSNGTPAAEGQLEDARVSGAMPLSERVGRIVEKAIQGAAAGGAASSAQP